MIDPNELRRVIAAAGRSWRVRDVPPGEHHALGNEQSDPELRKKALEHGEQLAQARLGFAVGDAEAAGTPAHTSKLAAAANALPGGVDWRTHGAIGPVQDQRACGSCVSFACTGMVAAMAAIEFGMPNLHLSEADSHFCSSHGASCGGWNNATALSQIQSRGVATDAAYPYMTGFDDPPAADPNDPNEWKAHCRPEPNRDEHCYRIGSSFAATSFFGIDLRKSFLASHGPLVCGFTVYQDFDHYAGGVYHHVWGNVRGGHAVMVVGYSDPEGAWICRNSWGTNFGGTPHPDGTGGGYFKIGYGQCNIDNEPFYGATGVTPTRQGNWRWCRKCECLGFAGHASPGPCAAGGTHDHSGSGNYFLVHSVPSYPGQSNWRWCHKCELLAFAGSGSLGACAAGGQHDHTGSGDYNLAYLPEAGSQHNWRWCKKCQALGWAGGAVGPCAAGGEHDHSGSGDYVLVYA